MIQIVDSTVSGHRPFELNRPAGYIGSAGILLAPTQEGPAGFGFWEEIHSRPLLRRGKRDAGATKFIPANALGH